MEKTSLKRLTELLAEKGLLSSAYPLRMSDQEAERFEISGCAHDSRDCAEGDIFVCKGEAFEARFLTAAAKAGAVAYMCDEYWASALAEVEPELPAIVATDIRPAMSVVAKEAWGNPDGKLEIVGITGTKGKTTASYMLRDIIDAGVLHSRAAIMGTIEKYDGVECFESRQTTPEAPELWRHLSHAADSGLTMVMEVSSQGLKYERMDGVHMDIGCFLNIGLDHISNIEHPDFEDYFASKLRIFEHCNRAVVCLDSDHLSRILTVAKANCESLTTFSVGNPAADVRAENIRVENGRVSFTCHTPAWTDEVVLGIAGTVNVENALAAIACAQLLGIGREQIVSALAACRVPGRMELYTTADGAISCIVDFAHNGIAFERVLGTLREEDPERFMAVVFGSTGGKAISRREGMARAAAEFCDFAVYTTDDPGPEDPQHICEELARFAGDSLPHEIVVERPAAVARAFEEVRAHAAEGPAMLCVLGKGNEDNQYVNGVEVPCETDAELVRAQVATYDGNL